MAKKLPNGCSHTEIWVHPTNWKTSTSTKGDWRIECKFYDPNFLKKYPHGFLFRRRFNSIKSLKERKVVISATLQELPILFSQGYNPITKEINTPKPKSMIMQYDMYCITALKEAVSKIQCTKNHSDDMLRFIKRFEKKLLSINYFNLTISELKRSIIKEVLMEMELSDYTFNKYRAYLSSIYAELVEWECVESNIIRDIRKRKTIKKIRLTMSLNELQQVFSYLKENQYDFYRYGMIFFHSGARTTELFNLKIKDINLSKQEYKITIKKGKVYTETIKVILPAVYDLWNELIQKSTSQEDYLFSKGLVPGPAFIQPRQITIRYKRHVKKKLCFVNGKLYTLSEAEKLKLKANKIDADFYALKHLFLDEVDRHIGEQNNIASKLASHTTPKITNSVYLVGKKNRENEILKNLSINVFEN